MAGKVYLRTDRDNTWYMTYIDADGKRVRKSTRTKDKTTAQDVLAANMTEAAKRRAGLSDPTKKKTADGLRLPVAPLVDAFERKLIADGTSERWRSCQMKWLRSNVEACGFKRVQDIRQEPLREYIATLREQNWSGRKLKAHVRVMKQFCDMLVNDGKLRSNPLASMRTPDESENRKRERRMLLHEEWEQLRDYLRDAPSTYGMSAFERRVVYETAIQTGLRVGEIDQLSRGKLSLTTDPPFVFAKPASTKNKKQAKQWITKPLASDILKIVSHKVAASEVFGLPRTHVCPEMLRRDLIGARTQWLSSIKDPQERIEKAQTDFMRVENFDGEELDFHALRYTCGAWLCLAGVDVRTVQRIMRHGSIKITVDTYGRLLPGAESAAIEQLGKWMG